ncbi:MAG: MerR family transcriptional regulator [Pseudomonadota bacterium]
MPIDPDTWYPADAPELDVIGARQTRARWRHEGRGPAYVKAGARVVYRGADVLRWLEARRVRTTETADEAA